MLLFAIFTPMQSFMCILTIIKEKVKYWGNFIGELLKQYTGSVSPSSCPELMLAQRFNCW